MSGTSSRLRAFKRRDAAMADYRMMFDLEFGSARKPRALSDIPEEEQGKKGSPLNDAYKALVEADKEWRNEIR